MGRTIVITSGKGGVGKTTTTANIGAALANGGANVLLIDSDIGLRNLDLIMGLENRVIFDIVDVLEGRCRIKQAIVKDKKNERLQLLPASQTRDKSAINEKQMRSLLDELRSSYDYILIDCPAGIEQGFKNAIAGADEAIIVCTPEVASIRDADRVIGLLASSDVNHIKLVVNRYNYDLVKRGDMLTVKDIEEILGVKAIGVIPDDEMVVRSSNIGEPIVNMVRSLAGKAYQDIAERLAGRDIPLNLKSFKPSLGTLFGKLLGIDIKAG